MNVYQSRMLAVSLAGHDKGKCYVVLEEENGFFYLTDGRLKPLERPKKKNQKHLQPIKHIPEEIAQNMGQIRDNTDIKKIIKMYNSLKINEEGK